MPAPNSEQRKLAAIMFTDMVGYSALAQRNEALALELLAESQRLLRTQFALFNGREVKTTGDGFLVEFPSALQATQCAVEIQRAVVARNATQPIECHVHVRIGIHVGDVVHREADMYGDGVNIAARIEPLAKGGGICLSDAVYGQVRNKLGAQMTKLDAPELKNIELPIDVYRVVLPWQQQAPVISKPIAPAFSKSSTRTSAVGLAVAVILGVTAWWFVHQSSQATKSVAQSTTNSSSSPAKSSVTPAADQKSIAVLPFVNMSADKADEYLSDGMTEELLNVLTKVKGLRVPGRSSSFAFKGKNEEGIFRKVGEQLHVKAVLEGSVRKAGNQLRITAQLINVADGFHLWSETYDRDMTNIFAIQSDVAQKVTTALKIQLGVEEAINLTKKPTENLEAYNLFLQGRFFHVKWTKDDIATAIDHFNRSVQLDGNFALGYAELAAAHIDSIFLGTAPKRAKPQAREAIRKALDLDNSLADVHSAMGFLHLLDQNWDEAELAFKRAFAIKPDDMATHDVYGLYFYAVGRAKENLREVLRAQELDPINTIVNFDLAAAYLASRQYEKAIAQCQYTLRLDPNNSIAKNCLALVYALQGNFDRAVSVSEEGNSNEKQTSYALASIYARVGKRDQALKMVRSLEERSKQEYVDPANVALVYAALGDLDLAFKWLDAAYEEQTPFAIFLQLDPNWDNIRADPRYAVLLKKVGLKK